MNDFTSFIEKKQQLVSTVEQLIEIVKIEFNSKDIQLLHHFQYELSKELTFKMLCIGDFSSGKSTFINRFLLQEDILPAFPKPTTTRLTKIRYGESLKAQLVFQDDTVEEVSINVTERLLEAVSTGGKDIGQVRHVILDSPSSILHDGIELVDAPGLNDPDGERMKLTFDYLHQADAILFFLNAQQPWTSYQKMFFERDLLSKKDIDKLFIVVNYWDQIDHSERQDVLDYIDDQLQVSLNTQYNNETYRNQSIDLHILPVSSKTGENGDNVKQHIWNYLANRKSYDVLSGKVKRLNNFIENYIKVLEAKISLIKLDKISRKKKRLSLEREVSDYKKRRDDFIGDLKQSLKPEFDEYLNTVDDLFAQLTNRLRTIIDRIQLENLSVAEINTKLGMLLSRSQDELTQNMRIKEDYFLERIKDIIEEQKGMIDVPSNNTFHITDYYLKWDELSSSSSLQMASIASGAVGATGILIGGLTFLQTLAAPVVTQGAIPFVATWLTTGTATAVSSSIAFGLPAIAIGVIALAGSFYLKSKSSQEVMRQIVELTDQLEYTISNEKVKVITHLTKNQKQYINIICDNVDHEITQSYNQKLDELAAIDSNEDQGENLEAILKKINSMKLQVNL
jgi:GTPase Era involved in 16S rRNA processing